MLKEEVNILLNNQNFRFAKSMPKMPHWYSNRNEWKNDKDFCDVVQFIRDNGNEEYFFSKKYFYYYYNGYKYWTLGNPLCYIDKTKTYILNKAKM
jgi:hypothetical protein